MGLRDGAGRALLVGVLSLVSVGGCDSDPVDTEALTVTVTVTPGQVQLGEPIRAHATVANISADAVVITGIRQTLRNVDEDRSVFDDELEGELTIPAGEVVTLLDGAISFNQDIPVAEYELTLLVTGPGVEAEGRALFEVVLP